MPRVEVLLLLLMLLQVRVLMLAVSLGLHGHRALTHVSRVQLEGRNALLQEAIRRRAAVHIFRVV